MTKCCTKCNIEKPIDQYETYFHSSQNKTRTRGYCISCFKEQKRIYRESIKNKKIIQPVEDLTPTIEYIETPSPSNLKKCTGCKEWKPTTEYYKSKAGRKTGEPTARCKTCHMEMYQKRMKKKMEDNGGHIVVPVRPGVYKDEMQRENTYTIMQVMGWELNDNGVWSKDGIKTAEKKWPKLEEWNRINKERIEEEKRLLKLQKEEAYRNADRNIWENIKFLREEGESIKFISDMYNLDYMVVYNYIRKWQKEKSLQ